MPNWKKVIISGSDAALSSLNVTGNITASGNISASGDLYSGAGLYIDNRSAVSGDVAGLYINGVSNFTNGVTVNRTAVPLPITLNGNVTASSNASVARTFLAGEDVLPNSTFALAGGSTSAIDIGMAISSSMGQVIDSQAPGETINAGQLVYKTSNGRWNLADADATSTSTNLLGIALNYTTGGEVDVLIDGVVTILSPYITAGDIGNPLYVDTDPGSITNIAPSGESDVVRIVGHYINSGTGFSTITFKPDGTWVEL
jgi:hypothetical protein